MPKLDGARRKILVIDDQPIVRQHLAHLIESQADLSLCGETDDARNAMELIATKRPDIVVTGLSLKSAHGLGFIKDMRARFPRLRVLVFSAFDEALYAERAVKAGAKGFVHKRENTEQLLTAIREILGGEIHLSPRISTAAMRRYFGRSSFDTGSPLEQLSDRELEVLQLVGQGRSAREIAKALHLDVKTIETYRARIKTKLNLDSAAALREYAQQFLERGVPPGL